MISKLEPVITETVLKSVCGADFSAQDIMCGKKPVSLYLRWPEAHVDALAPLIRLVWSTLFDDFKTIYDDRKGEGCREILAILDEAGRAPVPKLPEYASTVLGRKITLWIAYQSRSQPEKIYGTKGADELFDNIDSILYYRPAIGNYKSSAQMQEALGFTSAFAKSQTTHADHETSEGESEQKIPLMVASEIQRMQTNQIVGGHANIGYFRAERMNYRNWPVLLERSKRKPPAVAPLPDAQDIPPLPDAETETPDFIDPDSREIIVSEPAWPAVSRFQRS